MTHSPLPLPPPDIDERFDDDEPTKEGIERRVDFLFARVADAESGWERQLAASNFEQREIAREVKEIKETVLEIRDEFRKFMKFALEMRGDQFQLADRVSTLEQPRKARRKR